MGRAHVIAKLLVLAGVTVSYTSAQEVNSACRLRNGGGGVCQGLQSCPVVLASAHRERPVVCSFRGREPIVCCPTSGGPVQDISPPAVNFECGIQSERTDFGSLFRTRRQLSSNHPVPGKDFITDRPVVGGEDAKVNAWPWMALLGMKDTTGPVDWFCAGMLINEQWILTAAHCLIRETNVIRLGEHDYSTTADGANPEDFGVATTITYPDYNPSQSHHDLALIKLNKRVTIKPYIRPVCLPWGAKSSVDLVGKSVTVTGWGLTQPGGRLSPVLQEVAVTVFPSAQCDQDYKKHTFYDQLWPQGIGSGILCAGDRSGGKDACQGDSGGPAVYADGSGRFTAAGIISAGNGCALQDFPGLYTDVKHPPYLAWIREVAF
ncbi:venom protease-like [Penaeus japonicus]|uniref:venom protease-like n=1 Tax=Penaeus japonicus TaxID=27405 RepID=UPI001C711563|nr:venom protease-like [Penaeus japonicus]